MLILLVIIKWKTGHQQLSKTHIVHYYGNRHPISIRKYVEENKTENYPGSTIDIRVCEDVTDEYFPDNPKNKEPLVGEIKDLLAILGNKIEELES